MAPGPPAGRRRPRPRFRTRPQQRQASLLRRPRGRSRQRQQQQSQGPRDGRHTETCRVSAAERLRPTYISMLGAAAGRTLRQRLNYSLPSPQPVRQGHRLLTHSFARPCSRSLGLPAEHGNTCGARDPSEHLRDHAGFGLPATLPARATALAIVFELASRPSAHWRR